MKKERIDPITKQQVSIEYTQAEIDQRNLDKTNETARIADYEINHKYKDDRKAALPSIAEQLDMLYWDKENGTDLWFQMIKQNKLNIPKE